MMALEFLLHRRTGYAVIELTGKLTLGPHLKKFAREAEAILSTPGLKGLMLDLGNVREIDSSGLGELVILYTASGESSRKLCFIRTGARVARLLEITSLADLFPQFHDENSAVKWLSSDSSGAAADDAVQSKIAGQ